MESKVAFDELTQYGAGLAKALGHPARLAILRILHQRQACVCGTLVELLPLSQATVSQHLKVLKEIGLVQGTVEGPSVCYCIDPKGWERASVFFKEFFSQPLQGSCC